MSLRRTLSLHSSRTPAPRSVSARDRVFLFNSFLFTLFQTLLHSRKTQLFCFQSTPNSFAKTPGVGGRAISVSRSIRGCLPSSVHSSKFRIPQVLIFATLTKTAGVCTQNSHSGTQPQRSALNRRAVFFFNCKLSTVDSIRLSRAANSAVYLCTRML
jgi:hypothetical protein